MELFYFGEVLEFFCLQFTVPEMIKGFCSYLRTKNSGWLVLSFPSPFSSRLYIFTFLLLHHCRFFSAFPSFPIFSSYSLLVSSFSGSGSFLLLIWLFLCCYFSCPLIFHPCFLPLVLSFSLFPSIAVCLFYCFNSPSPLLLLLLTLPFLLSYCFCCWHLSLPSTIAGFFPFESLILPLFEFKFYYL